MNREATMASTQGRRAAEPVTVVARLRAIVESERRRAGVPGCAVAVVRNAAVLFNEGFGVRDVESNLPVTTKTLFPIGSSTKTFTAAVLAVLAGEGHVDLDAPIRTYVPGFAMWDHEATESLSLRDCLSHRSGLPRHDILWQAHDGVLTRRDVISALAHLPSSQPFRSAYQYNNLLYMVAGELAAMHSGSDFEDVVTARILGPLNMSRTNFSVVTTQQDSDHATPYHQETDGEPARRIPFAALNLAGPAGGINSCTDDLIPWLITLTGRGIAGRPPLLSTGILVELRTPAIPMPADDEEYVAPVGYGLGLMLADYRGRRISHHGGNIDGFSCEILTRDDGVGIAVLCNLQATSLRDAVPYLILDALDDFESPDHGAFFRQRLAVKLAQAEAAHSLPASENPSSTVRPLDDYAGLYRHPGYGDSVVACTGGTLQWKLGSISGLLRHREGHDFAIEALLNGTETRLAARFTTGPTGSVDALLMQLETAIPPIQFSRVYGQLPPTR